MGKLMTKMMLQMALAVFAVAVILGAGSLWITKESMEDQIFSAVRTEVGLRANHIVSNIESLKTLTQAIGSGEAIQSVLAGQARKADVMQLFSNIQEKNGDLIEMLILVDAQGNALVDHKTTDLAINIADRPYFQELMAQGEAVVSDVLESKATGNNVIVVASPVKYGDQVQGAVLATISFDVIKDIVAEAKVGTNGYGYLADGAGLVLSHKDPEKEMTLNLNTVAEVNEAFALLYDKMKTDSSGEGFYSYEGIKKFVAFERADRWIIALTADEADYLSPVYRIVRLTVIIGAGVALLALAITYLFTRFSITLPIQRLKAAMSLAGKGDFTAVVAARGRDEISELTRAYGQMVDNQRQMIMDMQKTAEQLNQMAEELNASSQEVAATSEEMTAAIETIAHHTEDQVGLSRDTVGALNKLEEGIRTSAALVEDALESSKACTLEAQNGKTALAITMTGMQGIDATTHMTVDTLHHMAEQAVNVSSISTAIAQIASQINLLALNASIEAARAGEHGRGFSVVADEVRKLAELTTAESAQINESLESIVNTVKQATESVDAMKLQVEEGSRAIGGTQSALERLYYGVESMIALNESVLYANRGEREMVEAVCAQLKSLDAMSKGISQGTQEISAGTEEQAAITQSLTQVAEETSALAEAVLLKLTRFKL